MSRKTENAGFVCEHCGQQVIPLTNGSYRNHCPFCLYSKHVDIKPGDRRNQCKGLMEPIDIRKTKKGFQLVHSCLRCRGTSVNRIAQNTQQPDAIEVLIALMRERTGML